MKRNKRQLARRSRPRRPLGIETLESRRLLAGVTLITHGFGGSVEGWVSTMADAIAARSAPADPLRYIVEVTDPGESGGPLTVTQRSHSGPSPSDVADPELVLLLDWSDVAGSFFTSGVRSTVDVAAAVADALLATDLLEDLPSAVAELPLHLIGHSRGGSLVGEIARNLGMRGVWVEQVTTLDPHPVDGIRDPFGVDYGDAPLTAWENVVFWDNYWRTDGDTSLDFTGEPIAGTHDVQLNEAVLGNSTGYFNEHSDVHLWYHGTIDTSGVIDDGEESVSAGAGWYNVPMGPRDQIGYYYSRVGGGLRPEAGRSASAGGSAVRTAIADYSRDDWPSLVELQITSPRTAPLGGVVDTRFFWHDQQGQAWVVFSLDTDRNPYNGLGRSLGDALRLEPSSSTLAERSHSVSTAAIDPGDYYLVATISDSQFRRYTYVAEALTLTAAPSISIDSHSVRGNVLGASVGLVTVSGVADEAEYRLSVDDTRFELVDRLLKLRDDDHLPGDVNGNVTVRISAERISTGSVEFQQALSLSVLANPFAWRNPTDHLDANSDGFVSPIDALVIINEIESPTISARVSRQLPAARSARAPHYYDTNGDGFISPIDVLLVINYLESKRQAEGEVTLVVKVAAADEHLDAVVSSRCLACRYWSTSALFAKTRCLTIDHGGDSMKFG